MRRAIPIAIACVDVALVAGALAGPGTVAPSVAQADTPKVLIVGDSLAVGMQPYLGEMMTDREITFDARGGRTTPQGMHALRVALQRAPAQTIVINLGTNDGASGTVFGNRVRRTLSTLPADSCVIWPAISRAPRKGDYLGLNRVLRREAQRDHRLVVLDWDRMVSKGAVLLPDGVHPDAEGYRFRSWVTAAAVRRGCGVFSSSL